MNKLERRLSNREDDENDPEYAIVKRFYYNQMRPLMEYINGTSNFKSPILTPHTNLVNTVYKKYLIVSCVSLIEKYITRRIRGYINEQKLDVSKFTTDLTYEKMLKKYPDKQFTKGQSVVAQHDFTSLYVINNVAGCALNQDERFKEIGLDFFTAVKKLDWYDPYMYIKGIRGVKPLTENWDNFMNMFDLRHRIIHEFDQNPISVSTVANMCDSTMNFLDATDYIFMMQYREDVLDRITSKLTMRQKNALIDKAMDARIAKGDLPADYVQAYYKHRGFDQDGKPV